MIHVIASMRVKEGALEQLLPIVRRLVAETVKEDGCKRYECTKDLRDDGHLLMLETWESQAHLDAHMQSAHFKALSPQMDAFCTAPTEITVSEAV
ncbi:MAG: antibiotic biosynthesis monooxygenase [Clostridiales Family XIII bacterium]|jgi:quinol monooxygenase YgiN|nr:antibiotic biosynthesis monooxygenase [Clostridiales Family XIII bacterium]